VADTLPMFPLNAVLFPGLNVPLRVFEDRYRALVHHLLRVEDPAERVFGSVGIREGYEVGEHGAQSLYRVGCRLQVPGNEPQLLVAAARVYQRIDEGCELYHRAPVSRARDSTGSARAMLGYATGPGPRSS